MSRWLVIEDNPLQREGYALLLKDDSVCFAADLACALEILGAGNIDGVISDLVGTGGTRTIHTIREKFPAVPVVILSGLDDVDGFGGDAKVKLLVKGKNGPLEARAALAEMGAV